MLFKYLLIYSMLNVYERFFEHKSDSPNGVAGPTGRFCCYVDGELSLWRHYTLHMKRVVHRYTFHSGRQLLT